MKTITIQLTDNINDIRNGGVGDYYLTEDDNLIIKAYMKDVNSYNEAWLIAMHELVEQRLTEMRGIKEPDIDAFDRMIDLNGGSADEAGNESNCPYAKEHRFAENIERQLCYEMNINWFDYCKYCE